MPETPPKAETAEEKWTRMGMWLPGPLDLIDSPDGVPRRLWRITVHRPGAWVVWPRSAPIVANDPDTNRDPSAIASTEADWARVFNAVRYAIGKCPEGREALTVPSVDVNIPIPLSETEYELAQSWVGRHAPVEYSYEDDRVVDGRHRLWLSRQHHGDWGVPVLAESLSYLGFVPDVHIGKDTAVARIAAAADWWDQQPDKLLTRATRPHRRLLAEAYIHLTDPEPVPLEWFDRLREPDYAFEALTELHSRGRTSPELLERVLRRAWRYKQDKTAVDRAVVLDMFHQVRFTANCWPATRPRGPLTLYRGATEQNRAGASWTVDPSVAQHFASYRQAHGTRGSLWTVTVPADRVLAYFGDEEEFIVDLTGLEHTVLAATDAKPDPATMRRTRKLRQTSQLHGSREPEESR